MILKKNHSILTATYICHQSYSLSIRLMLVACLVCTLGCGGGEESSSDNAVASNDSTDTASESSAGSDSSADAGSMDEGMMNEHGMSEESEGSGSEESMSEVEGMMGEHGGEGGYEGDDAEMQARMEQEYGSGEYGNNGNQQAKPRKPPRPEKVADWTPEHVKEAIQETDVKVIPAIELFANRTNGQARGVDQLKTWLTALNEKPAASSTQGGSGEYSEMSAYDESSMSEFGSGEGYDNYGDSGYGQSRGPSKKEQIIAALLNAFATNATKPAYETLATIMSGQLNVGDDQNKSMEMAFVTLMKNVSDPNNPAKGQLLKAITAVELDGAPPAKANGAEKETNKNPAESLDKKVKELHLGFALAAMNGLIGAKGEPPKGNQNNSSSYGGGYDSGEMTDYAGSGSGGPQGGQPQNPSAPEAAPVHIAPIDLKPEEAPATLSYLWSDEMIAYAASQLRAHPQSTEAFVFASAFPVPETREVVRNILNDHRLEPPKQWLHETAFATQLSDPAIHLLIKQFPRESRPGGNQGGGGDGYGASGYGESGQGRRPQANKKKADDPDAMRRQESSYGWMDASEKTLVSLMQRMYEGSQQPGAEPYDPAGIPFSIHKGAEVTASMQFVLPNPEQSSDAMNKAQQTIVNYVRIESDTMTQKAVLHYRNSLREKKVNTILGRNGMWLDAPVKANRKNNTLRSVDILLSKGNVRPTIKLGGNNRQNMQNRGEYGAEGDYGNSGGYGGNGGTKGVVEILTVEIPPPASEEADEKISAN